MSNTLTMTSHRQPGQPERPGQHRQPEQRVRLGRRTVALALVAGFVGCGLVSSDIARISFDMPQRHYVFDTSAWRLPPAQLPEVACTTGDECCSMAQLLGIYNCSTSSPLACDNGACALPLTVETPPQTVDLGKEVPELKSLSGQTVADVFISRIQYSVNSTLNVDLPPVELFLGPNEATTTSDAGVKKFGTVPATPANTMTVGDVTLEPDSQKTLSSFARNFAVPFKFLARTTIVVRGGQPIPSGSVDVLVRGRLSVQPSL